jgi:hypothetical protein
MLLLSSRSTLSIQSGFTDISGTSAHRGSRTKVTLFDPQLTHSREFSAHDSGAGTTLPETAADEAQGRSGDQWAGAAFATTSRSLENRLSRLNAPAPNAVIWSKPPAIITFLRKWII